MSNALKAQREVIQQAKLQLAAIRNRKSTSPIPDPQKTEDQPKIVEPETYSKPSPPRYSEYRADLPRQSNIDPTTAPEYNLYPNPYRLTKSLAFQKAASPTPVTTAAQPQPDKIGRRSGAVLSFTPTKKHSEDHLSNQPFSNNNSSQPTEPYSGPQRRTASSRRGKDPRIYATVDGYTPSGDTSKDVYSLEEISSQIREQQQPRDYRNDETDEYIYSMDNDESGYHQLGNTPERRSAQRSPKNSQSQQQRQQNNSGRPSPSDSKPSDEKRPKQSPGSGELKLTKTAAAFHESASEQRPLGKAAREPSPPLPVGKPVDLESSYSTKYHTKRSSNNPVQSEYSINNLSKPKRHTHDDDYWQIKQKIKKTEAAYKLPNSPESRLLQASLSSDPRIQLRHFEKPEERDSSKGHRAKETGSRESEQYRIQQLEVLKALRSKRASSSQPTILGPVYDKPLPAVRQKRHQHENIERRRSEKHTITASSTENHREQDTSKRLPKREHRKPLEIVEPAAAPKKKYLPTIHSPPTTKSVISLRTDDSVKIQSEPKPKVSKKIQKEKPEIVAIRQEATKPKNRVESTDAQRKKEKTPPKISKQLNKTTDSAKSEDSQARSASRRERIKAIKEKERLLEIQQREFVELERKKKEILEKKRLLKEQERRIAARRPDEDISESSNQDIQQDQSLEDSEPRTKKDLDPEKTPLPPIIEDTASEAAAQKSPAKSATKPTHRPSPPRSTPKVASEPQQPVHPTKPKSRSPKPTKTPPVPRQKEQKEQKEQTEPEQQQNEQPTESSVPKSPPSWRKPAVPQFSSQVVRKSAKVQPAPEPPVLPVVPVRKPALPAEAVPKKKSKKVNEEKDKDQTLDKSKDHSKEREKPNEADESMQRASVHERLYRSIPVQLQVPSFKQLEREVSRSPN